MQELPFSHKAFLVKSRTLWMTFTCYSNQSNNTITSNRLDWPITLLHTQGINAATYTWTNHTNHQPTLANHKWQDQLHDNQSYNTVQLSSPVTYNHINTSTMWSISWCVCMYIYIWLILKRYLHIWKIKLALGLKIWHILLPVKRYIAIPSIFHPQCAQWYVQSFFLRNQGSSRHETLALMNIIH